MIWGAISFKGPVHMEILNGVQNAQKYRDLLATTKPVIEDVMEDGEWVFQQDHAAIHTARLVQQWFREENIQVLEWPSNSPDLNIIENLWGWLSRNIYGGG